ncbi:MAG: AI-2E family transporter [Anaerolineaceae bacterium]|nr:AI-2E family transporter [Anaerolineaceae bacterium]
MNHKYSESSGLRSASKVMLFLASFVVVVFGMREAAQIITPIIIAFIVAILFSPFHGWLIEHRMPPWLALVIVMLVILLVISVMVGITVVSITQFINRIPEYSNSLQGLVDGIINLVKTLPIDVSSMLNFEFFNVTQILNVSGSLLSGMLDAFSNWFVVFLLVALMLADFVFLPEKFKIMFSDNKQLLAFSDLILSIRQYLSITTSMGLIIGLGNAVLLLFMGVDFAVLWGILGFLMNFIPSIGIIISVIPPVLLALLEFGWQSALISGAGIILFNFLIENVLQPRIMEEDLNISPLFIMISLVLWTFVLGPVGTILAVPLTLIATKLFLEASDETRWLVILTTANPRHKRTDIKKTKTNRKLNKNNNKKR